MSDDEPRQSSDGRSVSEPERARDPGAQPLVTPTGERLDSWKAIATYLNRDIRTVQLWEKHEGLPVRRHHHIGRATVYAYTSELDCWRDGRNKPSRPVEQGAEETGPPAPAPETAGQLTGAEAATRFPLQPAARRAGADTETSRPSQRVFRQPAVAVTGIVIGVLLLALLGAWYARSHRKPSPLSPSPRPTPIKARRSVAVLGFKNLGHPDAEWLGTALSEMIGMDLAAGEQLRMIPGENVAEIRIELSLPDGGSGYAAETLSRIRKNLGADDVIMGSYVEVGQGLRGRIRLDLQAQDTLTHETVCAVSETGTEGELFELVSKAGSDLREHLGIGATTASEMASVRASLPSDPEAARLYSEGLVLCLTSSFTKTLDLA
jgi:TolB-like protein